MDVLKFGVLSSSVSFMFCMEEEEILLQNSCKRKHRFWMAPYLYDRSNPNQRNTLAKLEMDFIRLGSIDEFRATLRMPPDIYQELITLVSPYIQRANTNYRMSISPEERISMTMRYLALGDRIRTLHQAYLVGYSSVQPIVRDTCKAIYRVLHDQYLKTPTTSQEWLDVAHGFETRWNMPNVVGAVDGKHIRIRCPKNSGSLYYNYKNYFSLVLLGVVDSDYKFLFVDVGSEGRASDSRIWRDTKFFSDIESEENVLNLPDPSPVRGFTGSLPYYFVGDDAFALSVHMMKPFPSVHLSYEQRIFNYRLSRCRRIVENAFGILASRFKLFMRQQDMEPEGVQMLVLASVVLHNFLRVRSSDSCMPRGSIDMEDREHHVTDGHWRQNRQLDRVIGHQMVRNHSVYVKEMRKALSKWCVSRYGEVPWQNNVVYGDV